MGLSRESDTRFQPLVIVLGGKNRRRNWVIFRSKSFPALPWGLDVPVAAVNPSSCPPCWFPVSHLVGDEGLEKLGVNKGLRRVNCPVPGDEGRPSHSRRPLCLSRSISSCPLTRRTNSTRQPGTSRRLSTFSSFKPVPTARPAVSTDPSAAPVAIRGWISLKGLLWGHLGRSVPPCLLCCQVLLSPEQQGGLRGRHDEAAAFETLFAQLPRWKNCLGSSIPTSVPPSQGHQGRPRSQRADWLLLRLLPHGVGATLCLQSRLYLCLPSQEPFSTASLKPFIP